MNSSKQYLLIDQYIYIYILRQQTVFTATDDPGQLAVLPQYLLHTRVCVREPQVADQELQAL